MPDILRQAGFKGIVLEILAPFCSGLEVVYQNLLQTPHMLTGYEYKVMARVHLGFQAVQIFWTVNITASIKQIVSYVPYYVDKARADASLIGLPLTLANFNDALMETAHKLNKSQSLLFSGGRTGPISKNAYQKLVIKQQFQNEAFQLTSRENTPQKSSSAKEFSGGSDWRRSRAGYYALQCTNQCGGGLRGKSHDVNWEPFNVCKG